MVIVYLSARLNSRKDVVGGSLSINVVVQMSGEATRASADDILCMAYVEDLGAWNSSNRSAIEWVTKNNN